MGRVILFIILVMVILLIVGMVAAQEPPPPLGDSIVIKWDWTRYRNYLPVVILR